MKESLRIPPNFIEPSTIKNMTEEQQVEFLEGIRARRMAAVSHYLVIQEEKKKVTEQNLALKFEKVANRIAKHVDKIDDLLAKVEFELNRMKALRLEAFDVV